MQNYDRSSKNQTVNLKDQTQKEVAIPKLPFGTYPVRFFPVFLDYAIDSPDWVIVQNIHYLGKKVACPRLNFDYTTKVAGEIQQYGLACPVCQDSWVYYNDGMKDESSKLRATSSYYSLVSFYVDGAFTSLKAIRYTYQLFKAINDTAQTAVKDAGKSIAALENGFLFNIIISEDNNRRSYKSSSSSMANVDSNMSAFPWKEQFIDLRTKLEPIKSYEQVLELYKAAAKTNGQKYNVENFKVAPLEDKEVTSGLDVEVFNKVSEVAAPLKHPDVVDYTPKAQISVLPCHGANSGVDGYIMNDNLCMHCKEVYSCKAATQAKVANTGIIDCIKTPSSSEEDLNKLAIELKDAVKDIS